MITFDYIAAADYREGSELDRLIKTIRNAEHK